MTRQWRVNEAMVGDEAMAGSEAVARGAAHRAKPGAGRCVC